MQSWRLVLSKQTNKQTNRTYILPFPSHTPTGTAVALFNLLRLSFVCREGSILICLLCFIADYSSVTSHLAPTLSHILSSNHQARFLGSVVQACWNSWYVSHIAAPPPARCNHHFLHGFCILKTTASTHSNTRLVFNFRLVSWTTQLKIWEKNFFS